jgi:predicted GTPase
VAIWRLAVLATLVVVPAAFMIGLGGWALYTTGWWAWIWWLMPLCWGAAWLLSRRWKKQLLAAVPTEGVPVHWTRRDEQALTIIQAKQSSVSQIPPAKLIDPNFYFQSALDLSGDIARHYHPKASDPVGSLTVPEILAAGHLALEDMELWVQQYVPGSRLVTVDHVRLLAKAPKYYDLLTNVGWAVGILTNPVANIPRFVVSKTVLASATNDLQANMLAAFYAAYLGRVGRYCIEMNSGRLRGGADKFREAMSRLHSTEVPATDVGPVPAPTPAPAEQRESVRVVTPTPKVDKQVVTIAIVGQVKAGKSSLINALLGERQAKVDVLPETRSVRRYHLDLSAEGPEELILLDTPGYNEAGATDAQDRETRQAVRHADLVLLVLDAKSPARRTDLVFIRGLSDWLNSQPQLKVPPIVAVLTHIDLLTPSLEWSPPYDWQTGTRVKEKAILSAVEYNSGQFSPHVDGVVPVCTDGERRRVYGVREWLLPAMTAALGEARAVAVIRTLHADLDTGRIKTIFGQLANAGRGLLKNLVAAATSDLPR